MGEKQHIENEIIDLENQMKDLELLKGEMWVYHPLNPNFINPIRAYEELKDKISSLERKINLLHVKLNSLN